MNSREPARTPQLHANLSYAATIRKEATSQRLRRASTTTWLLGARAFSERQRKSLANTVVAGSSHPSSRNRGGGLRALKLRAKTAQGSRRRGCLGELQSNNNQFICATPPMHLVIMAVESASPALTNSEAVNPLERRLKNHKRRMHITSGRFANNTTPDQMQVCICLQCEWSGRLAQHHRSSARQAQNAFSDMSASPRSVFVFVCMRERERAAVLCWVMRRGAWHSVACAAHCVGQCT